jgi:translocation and assembly module TamB
MDVPDPGDVSGAAAPPPRRWRSAAAVIAVLLLLIAVLIPAGLWVLTETPTGRAFVARQIAGIAPKSGLRFEVGRIDGSLLSEFTLHDVRVRDLDGVFAEIPLATIRWQPVSLIGRQISLEQARVPRARLLRMWRLNPSAPDEPLLPDINIHIGELRVGRLDADRAVAGIAAQLSLLGTVEIDNGRLLLDVQAAASAGDRLTLLLDAMPDANRFSLKADARAPAGGLAMRLAGLPVGITMQASGSGDWNRWRGRLLADVLPAPGRGPAAAAPHLADLAILGDAGRFRIRGELGPAPLLPASAAPLVAPVVLIDASAARADGRFHLTFAGRSDALAIEGQGGIDTRRNQLQNVEARLSVRRADLIDPRLVAQGLTARLRADGPLRNPTLAWAASARAIGWQRPASRSRPAAALGADNLEASGRILLPAAARQPLSIPLQLKARHIVGLPPELETLLDRPAATARIAITGDGAIGVDDLKLTTARISVAGRGRVAANGALTAVFDAEAAALDVPSLGRVTARVSARAAMPAGGNPTAGGTFAVRALRLENAGVRDFLGSLPTATGTFRLGPDGILHAERARLDSRNLRLTVADGRYDPQTGGFAATAQGRSVDYGPVAVAASGTVSAPRMQIRLAQPDFGVGLRNVVADVAPAGEGYAIVARGESPQGGLEADVLLGLPQGRPMEVDIRRGAFAGLEARGKLVATAAGPFQGALSVTGRGLRAQALLSAAGEHQRIDVDAAMRNARLPLDPVLTIASGRLTLGVTLVPKAPIITGSADLAAVRYGQLALDAVDARLDLAGEAGQGQLNAVGRVGTGDPFRLAAAVRAAPGSYLIGLNGSVAGDAVRLARPARITRSADGWQLQPARLEIGGGAVDMAGVWGKTREIKLALDQVGLAVLDYGGAGLGLEGAVSGQVALRIDDAAPLPIGAAALRVAGLSRSGLTGISVPVDMTLDAHSTGDGVTLGGRAAWKGNILGRLVLDIRPGTGDDMAQRFANGAMRGGVRYNGPVEPLWALVAPEGHDLKGPIAIAADLGGTPALPQVTGIVHADGLVYRGMQLGTALDAIRLDGRFSGSNFRLATLDAKAGAGTIHADGEVGLNPGGLVRLSAQFGNAQIANNDLIGATISGPLALDGTMDALRLSGNLTVDSARGRIVQMQTAEIPALKVRRAGMVPPPPPPPELLQAVTLAIRVRADDRIRVEGMGLDSVWRANVRIEGSASQPQIFGRANLADGEFSFASSVFEITSGTLSFNGAPLDSAINIQAETTAQDIKATVTIAGTAARPQISFSSTPSLPQDEILSRLLFGTSVANLSVTEAVQLASAVAGLQSGVDTMSKIRRGIGLDRLRLVGQDSSKGMSSGLAVGKRINRNLYAEVLTDSQGNTLTTVQWTLSRLWSIIAEVSNLGHSSLNARYQKEY